MTRMGNFMFLERCCCQYVWPLLLFFIVCEARLINAQRECQRISFSSCSRTIINGTSFPNIYGHASQEKVHESISPLLDSLSKNCPFFTHFLCSVFLPPCPENVQNGAQVLTVPCRNQCEAAYAECNGVMDQTEMTWPSELDCVSFPTEKCYIINGNGRLQFVEQSLHAQSIPRHQYSVRPPSLAPIESELGDSDQYNIEVVSLTTSDIPQRRYDVIDLGDPEFFQGWADVQGTGAANDYCRVIGRGKRKFLACALAGSVGQEHRYVSKLGFKPGHSHTWFMRDVDSDGRDDYCRCVGKPEESKIYCMKSGERGFYGSSTQGGSQFTFELPGSNGCHNRRLNPYHGA
ncbi:uncharacterized protein LOC121379247 [Gigantopelta aegis]|uniref:uncharacterized protein LOC121379247 n=1 Tax=Gigantopelta aegis TaxID=1735272 RepID=UPI001B88AB9F|nr:uncharacterized protein LOC121379247 [Gigantopelta aegis]